ncbi:PIN domain-containing protein [Candidatus Daviesbacteria bacterium]|nr:PIN domain-containing protein [Candidatus Daviesbacteria bacterium]
MKVKYTCITDADFLISLIKEDDINHKNVLAIARRLVNEEAKVYFPVTAILEAATALLRRYNLPNLASDLLMYYKKPDLLVIGVDKKNYLECINCFDKDRSKQNTPFDAMILALARNNKAEVVLSFDGFFKDKGFKTAKDLL